MYIFLLQANTFQVVIAADVQMTFVLFIYGDIQWSDGANIGFNAGDGTRSFMVPGALTNQTLNIDKGSNVGVRGVYIYRVDCSLLGPNDSIGKKPVLVAFSKYMLLIYLNIVLLIAVCNVKIVQKNPCPQLHLEALLQFDALCLDILKHALVI